ncbi:hypothetical protein [Pilimelia columellifera]|uniref:Uncharacterized protein n=1 Tax=Pilimelia columellifera subsp. columellifera TaxID=706583 RepID=A0ABN3N0V7_9ACTN
MSDGRPAGPRRWPAALVTLLATGGLAAPAAAGAPGAPATEAPGPALTGLRLDAGNRRDSGAGYDWSRAGYRAGAALPGDAAIRPEPRCRITAAQLADEFGVHPGDGLDDTGGLQRAIDRIAATCSPSGGHDRMSLIALPPGALLITRQLGIDADYLLLRGAGPQTRLIFRPDPATRYDTLSADGSRWEPDAMQHQDANGGWIWPGRGLLRVQSRAVAARYVATHAAAPANRRDLYEGSVNQHWVSGLQLGSRPGDHGYAARAGARAVRLHAKARLDGLRPGVLVNIMAANSRRFYDQMHTTPTEHPLRNLHMRQQVFTVVDIDAAERTVTLDKPLEYDVPVDSTSDGSLPIDGTVYPSKLTPLVDPVLGVGIENLTVTQELPGVPADRARHNYGNLEPRAALHGVVFKWAADSWVRNVRTEMTGSHPIVTEVARRLTITDNELHGAWNKGKGGNGYLRGSRVWDSVYAGNTTRGLRHFTFQWSASGNVAIGNSFDSDLNLHGGWERHNLFERNEVVVPYAHRPASCDSNCGDEGDNVPDAADWHPIWWAAGRKAVKWSGATGPDNVFHRNRLRKQLLGSDAPFIDMPRYGVSPDQVYRFGVGPGGGYRHLSVAGLPIADWAGVELTEFTDSGVVASSSAVESLFLRSLTR